MLDFVANNYLWFIVLGAVLLVIALILLFSRKKPIKEESASVQSVNESASFSTNLSDESLVSEKTETLEIIDDVANTATTVASVLDFEPVMTNDTVSNEKSEDLSFPGDEVLKVEPVVELGANNTQNSVEENVVSAENMVFEEPVSENNVTTDFDNIVYDNVSTSSEVNTVSDASVINEVKTPEVVFEPSLEVPSQAVTEKSVNTESVGDVVMPDLDTNKDNAPINNNSDEDIWKF